MIVLWLPLLFPPTLGEFGGCLCPLAWTGAGQGQGTGDGEMWSGTPGTRSESGRGSSDSGVWCSSPMTRPKQLAFWSKGHLPKSGTFAIGKGGH